MVQGQRKTSCQGQEVVGASAEKGALAYISRRRSEAKVLVMSLASSRRSPAASRRIGPRDRVPHVIRRSFRIGLWLGLVAGIGFALAKLLGGRSAAPPRPIEPTEPWPRLVTEPAVPDAVAAWVEPTEGACPTSHPVKAKLASKIFHVPGGLSYDRTHPDRCYVDAAAAEADGLRAAKR